MEDATGFKPELLLEIVKTEMPFGKYKGRLLCDLPDFYLEFFLQKGNTWPAGKLGQMMATVYEIKINGLHEILEELKKMK